MYILRLLLLLFVFYGMSLLHHKLSSQPAISRSFASKGLPTLAKFYRMSLDVQTQIYRRTYYTFLRFISENKKFNSENKFWDY